MIATRARTLALAAALACAAPVAAPAQTAPATAIMPGMTVVDPSGATVGMITSVKGDQLVLKTDKHEVQLPASSFTPSKGKLLFALTQSQLNTQTEQAMADANAKLVVGTKVYGDSGALVGTITAIDDQLFTLQLTGGKVIRMPLTAIAPRAEGAVLGITAAELQRMTTQAQ